LGQRRKRGANRGGRRRGTVGQTVWRIFEKAQKSRSIGKVDHRRGISEVLRNIHEYPTYEI
jgi:hypothetical protein